jgi:hypothetical protein
MKMAAAQALQDFRPLHFFRVIPGVRTKIFVTEHPVIGAHFFLGPDLHGAERAVRVHGAQRENRHRLLQGLGRQKEHLPPGGQSVGQRRMQAGGGFARSGGSFRDQVFPRLQRLAAPRPS